MLLKIYILPFCLLMKIWSHNESAKQIQLAYWTLVLNSQRNGSTLTLHSLSSATVHYTFSHFTLVSTIHMMVPWWCQLRFTKDSLFWDYTSDDKQTQTYSILLTKVLKTSAAAVEIHLHHLPENPSKTAPCPIWIFVL